MINIQPIARVVGILLLIIGGLMLSATLFSLYYKSGDERPLIYGSLCCMLFGLPLWLFRFGGKTTVNKREGYLIVALGWLAMVSFGMLPFLFSGLIPSIPAALFETVSGMTTTGATVLTDIESVPKGLLFWRSMTQWIGGMGIIVLTVAIFPLLGMGGIELFQAEAPGPTSDKIHPRIQDTAKRLWQIYVGLTVTLTIILSLEGMSFYDAINHALTTMATGGFSTKNASIAFFDSALIQYTLILFMMIAGTNYTILYFALKGRFRMVWQSDEFKSYWLIVTLLAIIVTIGIYYSINTSLEKAFRDGLFQIVSIITTTGFVTADYTSWSSGLTALFFILMFLGACAGSTSGGIKIIRHLVFIKNSYLEFKRILHPKAIVPLKLNNRVVAPRIMTHIIIFLLLYLISFVTGSVIVAFMGLDIVSAVGAVATSLGNVGPGLGIVGPVNNFSELSEPILLFLSFLMLLGRLELYTILVLFTPYFWKSN